MIRKHFGDNVEPKSHICCHDHCTHPPLRAALLSLFSHDSYAFRAPPRAQSVKDKSYFEKNRATLEDIIMPNVTIDPGYIKTYESSDLLPRVIYYSRKEPGTPKVSPKAGNMNAAIFPIDYPEQVPLIGDSTIVVVDDCRCAMNS
eukprot:TRINITY_DN3_c0_g1_i3.p1 TRINITY_DN3_c0_g1~~TRINITY_DN3_c0_g1_i3.p1  ORF type:complete len:145 (-),score=34.05 TRINITY_DN3_c0_g1_i3:308-742(-)